MSWRRGTLKPYGQTEEVARRSSSSEVCGWRWRAAVRSLTWAADLGVNPETLRKRVRPAEADSGARLAAAIAGTEVPAPPLESIAAEQYRRAVIGRSEAAMQRWTDDAERHADASTAAPCGVHHGDAEPERRSDLAGAAP